MATTQDMRNTHPRRILIIKPSSLGDIVHALPLLDALRAHYPSSYIAWLVGSTFAPLLDGHPLLDEVIPFDRRRYGRMLRSPAAAWAFLQFLRDLRTRRFDFVVDLQGLFRSAFLAYASGARRRVGFANAREGAPFFYNQKVACPPELLHAVDRNVHVARQIGLEVDQPKFPLGLRENELAAVREKLNATTGGSIERFQAVVPGARWETKRWVPERLAAVIDAAAASECGPPVLLGGPGDADYAARILAACRTNPINLVGKTTLRELTALLALAERVVCHDSGPMHIAAALGKPTIAIFGPTDPQKTGPYSKNALVIRHDVPCAPCRHRTCDHHSCMQKLDVEEVASALRENAPRPGQSLHVLTHTSPNDR